MKLYHGTRAANRESMERRGLVPGASSGADDKALFDGWSDVAGRDESVYLTPDEGLAAMFAIFVSADGPMVVAIDLPPEEAAKLVTDEAGNMRNEPKGEFLRYPGRIKQEWITEFLTGPAHVFAEQARAWQDRVRYMSEFPSAFYRRACEREASRWQGLAADCLAVNAYLARGKL